MLRLYWAFENKILKTNMKREIIYTDAPPEIEEALEVAVTIKNFLPLPSDLILKVDKNAICTLKRSYRETEYA